MLFYRYLLNNGETVTLEAIDAPKTEGKKGLDVLEAALAYEKYVTALVNDIYAAAYAVKDFRAMQFLDWFVKEQLEEEENADKLVNKYKLFGDDPKSLYLLDQELATRVYTAPSLTL